MVEFATASNSTVRARWIEPAQLSDAAEVCIFVSFAPGGVIPEYSRYHARAWAEAGFRVILVLNTTAFDDDIQTADLSFASGLLVRENRGYDFGAWATALQELPGIRNASIVALANDSMFGPLEGFSDMLGRVRAADADVIGATESMEIRRHFQSFILFFKIGALESDAFWRFWKKVRAGGRMIAICRYELRLVRILERAGLRCTALFASSDYRNPTLTRWRSLIEDGFPYVKVALLRDNPFNADLSGWEDVLKDHGYDATLVRRHLG